LAAQCVQDHHPLRIESNRERRALDHGHVVARTIGIGTIAMHHQSREAALHYCLVSGVETGLRSDGLVLRVAQVASCSSQQPIDLVRVGWMLLKLPDLQ
jgi:hypothetical protein